MVDDLVVFKPAFTGEMIEGQISNIPNYEDAGVSFHGKYKVEKNKGNYELKGQETRFYTLGVGAGAFGDNLFTRSRPETKFYCTKMIIYHELVSTVGLANWISLGDVKGTNSSPRFYYFPVGLNSSPIQEIDFSDCPRKFEGEQFNLYCVSGIGAGEFVVFELFGWEEND
jgi:hypothetical protein